MTDCVLCSIKLVVRDGFALPCFHDDEIFLTMKGMIDIRLTRLVCVAIFASWVVKAGADCAP